jgi:hypothetical protein
MTLAQTSARRVYILGAGFSRGFNPAMPLMADLAYEVTRALSLEPTVLESFNGDVEAWLSYLATRQPWDSEAAALRNLATFQEASSVIARVVDTASRDDAATRHEELLCLVLEWCVDGADVLTFNYDLLVEEALRGWERNASGPDLYPLPLVERQPVGSHPFLTAGGPTAPLPSIYKLHGSVNWMYSGEENSTGPVTLGPWQRSDPQQQAPRQRYLYSDLKPLVVPPTSSKSPFYTHSALRALWAAAAAALREAEEIIVIGYSFPSTDQQVTTLLRTTLRPGTRILVVTTDREVVDRVTKAFPQHAVSELIHPDAANAFVDRNCGHVLEWSHGADGDGVREWLRGPTGEITRMARYSNRVQITQGARAELSAAWPTIVQTWRGFGSSDGRDRYRFYVPRLEWLANPSPWPRADSAGSTSPAP